MPQTVEIPEIGEVEFPDEMSHEAISETIRTKIIPSRSPAPKISQEEMQGIQSGVAGALALQEINRMPFTLDWSLANEQKRARAELQKRDAEAELSDIQRRERAESGVTLAAIDQETGQPVPLKEAPLLRLGEAEADIKRYAPQPPKAAPTYEEFAKSGGGIEQYTQEYGVYPSKDEYVKGEVAAGRRAMPNAWETAGLRMLSAVTSGVGSLASNFAPSFGAETGQNFQTLGQELNALSQLNRSGAADVGRGLGNVVGLLVGNPAGKAGILAGAGRAASDASSQVLSAGGSQEEAEKAARDAFLHMAVYMGVGTAAGRLGSSIAGEEASALRQGVVGGAAATTANIGTSLVLSGGEHGLEGLTQDVLFGALGGAHAYQGARGAQAEAAARKNRLRELTPEESRVVATQGVDALESPQRINPDILPPEIRMDSPRRLPQDSPTLEQIRREGSTPPDPNRELGPGAANIEEFGPLRTIGAKNASVDAQRAERGLEPLMSEARKSDPETWDNMEKRVEQNPEFPSQLTQEIMEGKKTSVTDEEQSALLWRMVDLRNKRDMAAERAKMEDTYTPEERMEFDQEAAFHEKELARTEEADRKIGTASGRALRARRLMASEDYTLAAMESRARVAKGEPLTPEETAQIKSESERLQAIAKEQGKREAQLELESERKAVEEKIVEVGQYSPGLLERARKWIESKEAKLEAGSKRLREIMANLSIKASANPIEGGKEALEAIGILANEALVKLGRKGVEFAEFASEKIAEYGEAIRPYLQRAWNAAMREWNQSPAKPRKKTALQDRESKDAAKNIEGIEAAIKETAGEKPTIASLSKQIKELAKEYVKAGADTVEKLETKLEEFFKPIIPDVTKQQLRNEFSDYGKSKAAPTEPLKVKLSQLRQEAQKLSQLEALQAKLAPLRTGQQRVEQSIRARELTKQVNELKRQLGIVDGDPAKRLRSTLEAMQKRLENRIKDLRYEIAKGERSVKTKTASPTNAQIDALKKELATVQAEHEGVFGKRQMSEEQKKRAAVASAERSLKNAEAELADARAGKFKSPLPKNQSPHAEVRALQAKRDAIRAEIDALYEEANPKPSPEQLAIKRRKAQLARQIADTQERIDKGDFEPRKRKPPVDISKDSEAVRLAAEAARIKSEFNKRRREYELAKRSRIKKLWDGITETLATSRSLITSADVSAPFRQGGFLLLGDLVVHPVRAAKQIGSMFKQLASEKGFEDAQASIMLRPNAKSGLYEKAGLYLADMSGTLSGREETMRSNLAEKVPLIGKIVRASNRAYAGFLNRQRADTFDALVESLGGADKITPEQAKSLADFVNTATGRGNVGGFERSADAAARVLFSPRFLASRFQLAFGQHALSGQTKALVAQQYGKFAMGLAAVYGLSLLFGGDVEKDPRSADFGKAKFGNTRIDPLAGLAQVTTFVARMLSGQTMKGNRVVKQNRADTFQRFARTKLAPIPGVVADYMVEKTLDYQDPSLRTAAQRLLIPISYQDMPAVYREQGPIKGTIMEALNLMGMGLQHYDPKK